MTNQKNVNDDGITTVNNSLVFKVKKFILRSFLDGNKSFRKVIRKRGNMRFKVQLLDKKVPKVYKKAAKAPIDENKVVFVEVRHNHITNSLEVMFDEIANNYDYTIHTHFLLNNATTRADYEKRCLNAVKDIATAKYVFTDEASNVLSAMPLREGTKIIQLWHGCGAFKKFGFSTADLLFGEDAKEQLRHPFYKNYSLVSVSSPEVIWAYNEAMSIDEKSGIVQATGCSRTDLFYDEGFKKAAYDRVYEIVPQAKDKKIILYAPTFRGRVAKAQAPDMLNIKMFYDALGDDYVLLMKYHPLVKNPPVVPDEFKNFAMDVGDVLTIEDLLIAADICISDYSSLVFEYSLFERPLIFFAFDLDEYFDWRGFYYDYFELAPGLVAKTNFEMIDYIKNIDTRFDKKAIRDFREKFMRSCDGHATERIIQSVFENPEEHRKNCENFEPFHLVPQVESSVKPYFEQVKKLEENKKSAQSMYDSACGEIKETKGIIALDIESKAVRFMLRKKGSDVKIIKSTNSQETIKTIAGAKYIIIDTPSTLLDSLSLRADTKVILLPPNAFPLETFGKATMQYRSGLLKEKYSLAPLYSSVNAVCAPSDATAEFLKTTIQKDVEILSIGDIKTDALCDNKFIQRSKEMLYEAFEKLKGRKIIAYLPSGADTLDDSFIYEYLYKDYVLLRSFKPVVTKKNADNVNYYADSIVNTYGVLTRYQLLAIADIVISDFNSEAFSFMATGKPLIVYSKNARQAISSTEAFVDIENVCPSPIYTDTMDVVNAILDIDNYDYAKYYHMRQGFLSECDGNSTDKLMQLLK